MFNSIVTTVLLKVIPIGIVTRIVSFANRCHKEGRRDLPKIMVGNQTQIILQHIQTIYQCASTHSFVDVKYKFFIHFNQ